MIHDFQDFLPISIYSLIITNCTNFGFSFNELNVLLSLPSLAIKAVFWGWEGIVKRKMDLNMVQLMRIQSSGILGLSSTKCIICYLCKSISLSANLLFLKNEYIHSLLLIALFKLCTLRWKYAIEKCLTKAKIREWLDVINLYDRNQKSHHKFPIHFASPPWW